MYLTKNAFIQLDIVSGMRFALINVKIGLANILAEYELSEGHETPDQVNYSKKTLFISSDVGLPMIFKKTQSTDA